MPAEAQGGKLGTGAHMARVLDIRRKRSEAQEALKTLRGELKKETGRLRCSPFFGDACFPDCVPLFPASSHIAPMSRSPKPCHEVGAPPPCAARRNVHRLAVENLLEIAAMKGVATSDQGDPTVAPEASSTHNPVPEAPEASPQPAVQGNRAVTSMCIAAGGNDAAS